jgi:Ca-activated chloride channel family protein
VVSMIGVEEKMHNLRWFLGMFLLAGLLALIAPAAPALADGIIIVDPPPNVPPVRLDEALTIKYHRVTVTIEDQVATTRVDQLFLNENSWTAEGTYVFPLPKGAAVSEFVMWVDGQPVKAEILEADEARRIYDDIVRTMRDPALLEYVGQDLVKASIFPIPAGEERRIELEYSQVLPADNGLVHYVYPLSTEKFSARPLEEVAIRVEIASQDPIKAVYSPSHEVFIERDGEYRAVVGLEQSDVLPDKDFELYYSVSPEAIGLNLLTYKEAGQDGFFLLLVAPNVEVDQEAVVARDLILVLDVSGSMEGEKLAQAKNAATYILQHLNVEDRFAIIAFSTGLRTYRPELAPASDGPEAVAFVERLEALGGTDINRALLEGLALAQGERPATLIFLTDGLATEGEVDTPDILANVSNAAGRHVQLFSFGVGDDVDTDLLDALALDHGGTSAYVRPGQRIDEEVSAFYSKVSTPVLADVAINFGGIQVEQLYPDRIPDLFAGSQLVLVGRYREGGPGAITLSGSVNGERMTFDYPDQSWRTNGGDDFIPRLWATRAIGYYLTQIRLQGEKPEWIQTVVELSIRYGIITPYTSFLIEEDDIFTQTGRERVVEGAQEEMEALSAEPPFGADAVEKAAEAGAMRNLEAPMALPTMVAPGQGGEPVQVAELIKYVGSKTFVLRDGVWIDTAYDPATMDATQVGFMSDGYLELVVAVPELGDYFALGERVIAVYDDMAYETVNGPGEEVTIPTDSGSTSTEPTLPDDPPVTDIPVDQPGDEARKGGGGLCGGAIALPLVLVGAALVAGRRREG